MYLCIGTESISGFLTAIYSFFFILHLAIHTHIARYMKQFEINNCELLEIQYWFLIGVTLFYKIIFKKKCTYNLLYIIFGSIIY